LLAPVVPPGRGRRRRGLNMSIVLALERERTDAYNTIAEQRERLSLVSVQRGCPWPAVDYSGIACI
jgi:hypothetical protein